MAERGRGYVYLRHGAWHLQFYQTENRDGVLAKVRKSVKLHDKDREHNSASCRAVKALRDKGLGKITNAPTVTAADRKIVDYCEQRYLPYCEEELKSGPRTGQSRLKPSTLRGYKQVYHQHLKAHFSTITLQKYQTAMGYGCWIL